MIVVDTSVWVAAFRNRSSMEAITLSALLDEDDVALAAPIRIELLIGASSADRVHLRRSLSALPVLYPGDSTWQLIDGWIDRASAAGERFGFADLLIGAIAVERGAAVWSLDTDFERMAKIGLLEVHKPG